MLQFIKSRRGEELLGVTILAAGIIVSASLLTYHPNDSSAFFTSSRAEIANAIGYYGSTLAWILVGFVGFASLLLPAALLILGWERFWGREVEHFHTKFLGFLILAIALPPLCDLSIGEVWLRGGLIRSGGYLGSEINRTISANLNSFGAAVVLVTLILVGLLLATRLSLAAVFLAIKAGALAIGRAASLRWARFTERRRKEKMRSTVVRKHLDKAETGADAKAQIRLVEPEPDHCDEKHIERGFIVREVKGHGKFQIRKVTKADLRKAAEEIATRRDILPLDLADPVAPPPAPIADVDEFEDIPIPRPARQLPKPPVRKKETAPKRSVREESEASLSRERLPFVNLLTAGPQNDGVDEESHRKYLDVGHLIEERCREFAVEGEVTAYHPGPVVTTFEFKPSAGVKYAKVVNLGDDLALALKAESIRIERISGSSTVGIEVPNRKRELITLRDIIDTETFTQSSSL
ncbi:MAG: DNA translocase FtsK 4TM domain-containing protein, partial [Thermoanaerobaculia bacterium]